jgi:sporulation protein YlmC with PRC-barrel domain
VHIVTTTFTRELERLTHSGLKLSDPASDLRDREVLDCDGEKVGTVSDVLVEPDSGIVRLVEVTTGGGRLGIGRKTRLVPMEVITSGDPRTVYVERTRDQITAVDEYRPADGDAEEAQYEAAYAAFGVAPYWQGER